MEEIALFPLRTVLYPGGPLSLRIFETRYIDMVSRCLKEERGFGVCLIKEGGETGPAEVHHTGTLARIRDWSQGEDGLLYILARGERRFRLHTRRVQADGLNLGEAEWLPDEPVAAMPETRRELAEILRQIIQQVEGPYAELEPRYDDAGWVSNRLAELLPISLTQRQYLLELADPLKRVEILATLVQSLATEE
ncbi:MAG TPA: LON peptidase substrate-binding domain-containing protein [Gammaproteobacteria bacterium]|nr:LON peptidase substrate-binding domain-containing protein [Gammaproteobacteria bacterium]